MDDAREIDGFRLTSAACAALAVLAASAMLGAWFADAGRLVEIRLDHLITGPFTSISLLLLSVTMVILALGPSKPPYRYLAVTAGVLVTAYGLFVLADYFWGRVVTLDDLLPEGIGEVNGVPANATSPVTGISLIFSGLSLALLVAGRDNRKVAAVSLGLAQLVGLNAFVIVIAYLFGVPLLHNARIIPMALVTAIASLLLAISLLSAAGPAFWPAKLFVGCTLRARLMRVFLPLTLLIVIVEGLVVHLIHTDIQSLNPALVAATLAMVFILISGLLVTRLAEKIGGSIDRAERERAAAEAELRKSEENYRRLFEDSPMPLAVHRRGILIDINRAGVELIGGDDAGELIGNNVIEFVHPDYRELAAERMKSVYEKGGMAPAAEERFLTMDGRVIDVSVSAMGIKYRGDDAVQVAMLDITEKKQLEEQLRQAQKMESVGTLAGGIAHDFNNYLTAIQGYIDLSLMDLPEDSPIREELSEARRSADRASDLTRQVLLFSRREPMDLKPCDLSHTIEDMHRMLGRLLGERYTLETSLAEQVRTVIADPGHMEQVIMNLVVNARDAMPEGGRIRIGTENVTVDEVYASEHPDATPGEYTCLVVSDEGAGMDRATMNHIFDPFFSTKKGAQGTGLGLSVVYGIVSQHDGWIHVDSSPGKGTKFRVFIPAAQHKVVAGPQRETSIDELRGHGERVLLVEDEEAVRGLANRLLSENGYQVYAAADVEEADRIFTREDGDFDLVFSDIVLPGEDGVSFVGRLRRSNPDLPVLLASGYSGDETRRTEIENQGLHVMQKPYSLVNVMRAIREILN